MVLDVVDGVVLVVVDGGTEVVLEVVDEVVLVVVDGSTEVVLEVVDIEVVEEMVDVVDDVVDGLHINVGMAVVTNKPVFGYKQLFTYRDSQRFMEKDLP